MRLWYALTLGCLFIVCLRAMAGGERDHDFRRGRFNRTGNERSERPGQVTPGAPAHSGNGCPPGTMRVVFAPDALSFTVLFDQFVAQVDGSGAKRDVMSCDALIPLQLPEGMRMQITRVDFRGFVALPDAGSRAVLHSVFNFRGGGGDGDRMNLHYQFDGPVTDNYQISTDALADEQTTAETSPCGGSTRLRIFNEIKLVSRDRSNSASATIDSIDGGAHATYYLNWKSCTRSSRRS
jgi:hypothetical protein